MWNKIHKENMPKKVTVLNKQWVSLPRVLLIRILEGLNERELVKVLHDYNEYPNVRNAILYIQERRMRALMRKAEELRKKNNDRKPPPSGGRGVKRKNPFRSKGARQAWRRKVGY